MGPWIVMLVLLIPLGGILLAGFREWLEFKSKQDRIGTSTMELEQTVETLKGERAALKRRIENLETIVTSEAWDTLHEGQERGRLENSSSQRSPSDPSTSSPDAPGDAAKTARMARRLQTDQNATRGKNL